MKAAPVSVIIPFYNGHAFLQRAIGSIDNQTLPPTEIVVVDDGSTDSLDISDLACRIPVRAVRHPINMGIAAARNTGVEAASADWVAFLDQDDEWLPDKLRSQWSAALDKRSDAERTVFYGRAVRTDRVGRDLKWPRSSTMKKLDKSPQRALHELVVNGNLVPFITVLFSKDLWRAAGAFDERLRGGSDDYAILLRLAALGYEFCGTPDIDVIARRHDTGFNFSAPLRFLDDDLVLLERLRDDHPHIAPLLKRGLGAAHYRAGRATLDTEPTIARQHLRTAIALRPLFPRAYVAVVSAYAPRAVRELVTTSWERIRHAHYRA